MSRAIYGLVLPLDHVVHLSRDIALQTADSLHFRVALRHLPCDVILRSLVRPQPADGDDCSESYFSSIATINQVNNVLFGMQSHFLIYSLYMRRSSGRGHAELFLNGF